ncbi:MAG: circadian clock protein KaiC [Candidatus Methanogaster sp.]|uniref:Circadian clock protein KaiC n=1 Tax=Candidatus Methanogaster sp. TaxID=3386292 RepID=A0AC61KZK4_9EURY|nr:MAG: circadian clock protein KaiC [ANME-2 cluster archaeon]
MMLRSTGITGLDEILGGFQKPSTILVAGTAGVGKTMFVLDSLSSVAEDESTLYIPITTRQAIRADFADSFPSMHKSIALHPIDRISAERDPLSALIDIGNAVTSSGATRVAIDPITPLGYAFSEQEQHRFIGTFDSMAHEWGAITLVTGELTASEIHAAVVSHFMDGVLYLSYEESEKHVLHNLMIFKTPNIAGTQALSNIYSFNISTGGVRVFPHLKGGAAHPNLSVRVPTGIQELDGMLEGGIPETYSMLIAGSPGTGKTIFGLQFANKSLENDKPAVIVSFNESPDQLMAEAMRLGWDMQEHVENDLLRFVYPSEQVSSDEHLWQIKDAVESIGAGSMVFDGITDMKTVFCGSVNARKYIYSLIRYLKYRNVTSIFTSEIENVFSFEIPDAGTSFMVDGIVSLRYIRKESGLRKLLLILKMRGTNHDRRIKEYTITDHGINIME